MSIIARVETVLEGVQEAVKEAEGTRSTMYYFPPAVQDTVRTAVSRTPGLSAELQEWRDRLRQLLQLQLSKVLGRWMVLAERAEKAAAIDGSDKPAQGENKQDSGASASETSTRLHCINVISLMGLSPHAVQSNAQIATALFSSAAYTLSWYIQPSKASQVLDSIAQR